MISMAEISSNKNIKRPVIVAFLNSSGVVWTTGPKLPRLLMTHNNQTAFFHESNEKKSEEVPRKREMHHK